MAEAEVYEFLAGVFRKVFGRTDIVVQPALSARDVVGWDSLRQVQITLALEEQYGIRIRTRELAEIGNVGELVALVERKRGALG